MTSSSSHAGAARPWRLGITLGDPSGIGPEVILKALSSALPGHPHPQPILYGAREVFAQTARWLDAKGVTHHVREGALHAMAALDLERVAALPRGHLPVIEVASALDLSRITPGEGAPEGAHLQLAALQRAIEDAREGHLDAIVTAPWTKELFRLIQHAPVGHTEVLERAFHAPHHVMMLAGERLRVSLATVHVPLKDVSKKLTATRLDDTICTTIDDLRRWFGIEAPRVAVCGLNPHAGEHGVMGEEEDQVIRPTIERVRHAYQGSAEIVGPLPSDTLFARYHGEQTPYDAVVCMYHDQGLIPLKLLHFGRAANLTLGLPVLRTSVDHGTAYDIAGEGVAREDSMRYAMELAVDLLERRAAHEAHPRRHEEGR